MTGPVIPRWAIERSDDLVIIQITLNEARPVEVEEENGACGHGITPYAE